MVDVRDVQRLAEWWTSASQEARWLLLRRTIEGPAGKETPSLRALHIAIYLAESEAGDREKAEVR